MMSYWSKDAELEVLIGKQIKEIKGFEKGSSEVQIKAESGELYSFCHIQDCCENVELYDFEGDSNSLCGAIIISADEVSSDDEKRPAHDYEESYTWTFYKIETTKGEVFMRWFGESNGYYSEGVDFLWLNKPDD